MMNDENRKKEYNQQGFTLIEMAVSMIIIGLLVAPLLVLYGKHQQELRLETTYNNVRNSVETLQAYKQKFGAYPCPASMTAARGNAAYGRATACRADGGAPDPAILALNYGDCANGICVEETLRPVAELAGNDRRVFVGAFPFRDMQREEVESYDGYGRRLLYVVSYATTDTLAFDNKNGAIAVQSIAGENLSSSSGNVPFLVLSHGRTGVGAYEKYGGLNVACPAVGTTADAQNCTDGFQDGSGPTTSIYVSSHQGHAAGANFFDDYMFYMAKDSDKLWRRVDANVGDIEDIQAVSLGNVGIGMTQSESATVKLDVSSGLNESDPRIVNDAIAVFGTAGTGGAIYANRVCDEDGGNCFDPALLIDNNALKCPTGYLAGIESGAAVCREVAMVCNTGEVLVGRNPNGSLNCEAVPNPGCAAGATLNICGVADYTLANDEADGWSESVNEGDCRRGTVRCTSGTLSLTGVGGYCTDGPSRSWGCGWGYTGRVTQTLCGVRDYSACNCAGGTYRQSRWCPWPSVGRYTRTYVRTPNPAPSRSCRQTYTDDRSPCACPIVTPSPAGYTCNDGSGDTCRVVSDGSCPANNTGNRTREQKYDNAACTWRDTGVRTSTCACDVSATLVTTTPMATCAPCGDAGSVNVYTATITDTLACTFGAAVLTTPGTCSPRSFAWRSVGTAGSGTPRARSTIIGSGCDCADNTRGNTQACYVNATGRQDKYRCKCQ